MAELKVLVAERDGRCQEWHAALDGHGYGQLQHEGVRLLAHRAAWELVYGPIADGLEVHHICANPLCVNVDHLALVTRSAHMRADGRIAA